MLSRRGPSIPLYVQVRDRLAREIAGGTWKPGGMLPNEAELARDMSVSLGTVRRALEILENEQVITRQQGRGTFVRDPSEAELTIRFSNIRDRSGRRVSGDSVVLQHDLTQANEIERSKLKLGLSDMVLRTVRVREFERRPFMFEEASLAVRRVGGPEGLDGTEDLRVSRIAHRAGVFLAGALESVSSSLATAQVAASLGISEGSKVLKLERVVISTDEDPIEWRIAYCVLNDLEYVAEMT